MMISLHLPIPMFVFRNLYQRSHHPSIHINKNGKTVILTPHRFVSLSWLTRPESPKISTTYTARMSCEPTHLPNWPAFAVIRIISFTATATHRRGRVPLTISLIYANGQFCFLTTLVKGTGSHRLEAGSPSVNVRCLKPRKDSPLPRGRSYRR